MAKNKKEKTKNKEYLTTAPNRTKKLGEKLAKELLKKRTKKTAFVIGLEGELGGGKTTFLQGFAKGLGIKEKILSPTFVIYRKIQIPKSKCQIKSKAQKQPSGESASRPAKFQNFFHVDCYRIQRPKELFDLGFREIISESKNIIAIEWADKIKKIMPKNSIWIKFKFVDEKTRRVTIRKFYATIKK